MSKTGHLDRPAGDPSLTVPEPQKPKSHELPADYYFMDLVLMLASSAKIDLGELTHPYYHDKVINFAQARTTINMISALVKKTSGNLDLDEKKVLREVIEDLQKTYVAKISDPSKQEKINPDPRPALPLSPKIQGDVKEWISLVQQEMAKKKQPPPSK